MKLFSIEELKKLMGDGVMLVESRARYKKENRDIAALALFVFSLVWWLEIILLSKMMSMPFYVNGWFFVIALFVTETWLFYKGMSEYLLYKEPEKIFLDYFAKRYLKLVLLGPIDVNGAEYVYHGFITKGLSFRRVSAFFVLNIRKDIHQKAMDLNKKVYDIAFDKHGNRKFVSMDGVIEDADEDVILVARFINALYALYGEDIHQLKIETDVETRRRERL